MTSGKAKGRLIAIEGVDGAGCTTQSKMLVAFLKRSGRKALYGKEPSEGPVGVTIRRFLKRPLVHPALDALLYAADRADHVYSVIKPALKNGYVVVCDRYIESSLAYQTAEGLDLTWVTNVNKYAIPPELCILLDIDPRISLSRKDPSLKERFETEEFLREVRANFRRRAQQSRLLVVDATKSIRDVHLEIRRLVRKTLQVDEVREANPR